MLKHFIIPSEFYNRFIVISVCYIYLLLKPRFNQAEREQKKTENESLEEQRMQITLKNIQ